MIIITIICIRIWLDTAPHAHKGTHTHTHAHTRAYAWHTSYWLSRDCAIKYYLQFHNGYHRYDRFTMWTRISGECSHLMENATPHRKQSRIITMNNTNNRTGGIISSHSDTDQQAGAFSAWKGKNPQGYWLTQNDTENRTDSSGNGARLLEHY